jgi:integrase
MHKLTLKEISELSDAGRHADGGNGYVQRTPGGGLSYLFRYRRDGKAHWMGCGPLDRANLSHTLATARQKAAEARRRLADGEDLLEHKRAVVAASAVARSMSVNEVATAYIATHGKAWRNDKHRAQWKLSLDKHILPVVGKLDVRAVGVDHVRRILAPIWMTRPETARRTRGRLEMVLDFAAANNWRSSENPARQKLVAAMLGRGRPAIQHHASLPYAALPDLMAKLDGRSDVPSLCLQWLVLTCVRSQEARGARRSEVDRAKAVWTVPAERMKRKRVHRVPLSPIALDLFDRLPSTGEYLFPGQLGDCVSDTALRNVLRACGINAGDGSVHGFRSSFRDWAADNSVDDPVAEACLAHAVPDKVVAAYKRTTFFENRLNAMIGWSLAIC